VKTQKAEEKIKQQNLDMVDLRQAAGPTADLIQKLKDEVENYKRGELSLRKELHATRQQIKQVSWGIVLQPPWATLQWFHSLPLLLNSRSSRDTTRQKWM
jgi:hypothetical protein